MCGSRHREGGVVSSGREVEFVAVHSAMKSGAYAAYGDTQLYIVSEVKLFNLLQSSIFSTRKGICRTGRVHVHCRCVRLCGRVFTTL